MRYFVRHLLPVIAVAGVILALDSAGIDPLVSRWFYDPRINGFPLRYNGFVEVALHHGAKYLVVLVAVAAYAAYLISYLSESLRPRRALCLFIALSLTLAPLAIATMKFFSMRHCPWDVAGFGGYVPYAGLLETYPFNAAPGRCFPAGHASTGFCLFAFYFAGIALKSPAWTRAGFALGLATGLGLGLVRIMQGAHFATHVLWSGVVCWVVIVVLYGLMIESRSRANVPYGQPVTPA